jgi:2-polyprenyl-6-methoxyphenol hydroxylase-like FAD-dependent oxidoreductase
LSANARLRCVINGGGIAGPTLAYWLRRLGHDVLLIEEAPSIRTGGYVVDFWGVGYDVAEKMGLLPRIHELGLTGCARFAWSTTVAARPAVLDGCNSAAC